MDPIEKASVSQIFFKKCLVALLRGINNFFIKTPQPVRYFSKSV